MRRNRNKYSLDSRGGPVDAVDAEGAAEEMALDTDAEADAVEMALETGATDEIALDTDATEVPETMVETDADALLTPLERTEETDARADDAMLVRTEDTTTVEETAADDAADDADTTEETSLVDWPSEMAARRRAQRAERRALRTTMALATATSRKGGLGESSEDAPWVYIPCWSDEARVQRCAPSRGWRE